MLMANLLHTSSGPDGFSTAGTYQIDSVLSIFSTHDVAGERMVAVGRVPSTVVTFAKSVFLDNERQFDSGAHWSSRT
jgi:hypothetical protein